MLLDKCISMDADMQEEAPPVEVVEAVDATPVRDDTVSDTIERLE